VAKLMFSPTNIDEYANQSAQYIIDIQKSAFVEPEECFDRIVTTIKRAFLEGKDTAYREDYAVRAKKMMETGH